ncbi:MAG: NAD-dependent succinate-semialdehyde dehydrogenase [Actinomycetaceae bacterium]|nr:NAD-dependent succinate-semialdehyde dehydrogenase [Arcanobacterium sp.]MDD7687395.1 NAD-dependent succinate-semialdehyde dehydrogenase [Actinomycetaceae bacterium]MDY5272870.1 NAD-dependent succinate-semialdehyde dehydrogenase [Arcanobacterium sp.]
MSIEIPAIARDLLERLDPAHGLWINGEGRAASSGETFAVYDPATEEEITQIANGSVADAKAAVDAAAAAFESWRDTAPRERGEILRAAWGLMIDHKDELAALMSWENGKAISDSLSEVNYAAEFFRWFSEEAVRSEGDYAISPAGGTRTIVTHHPVGVAALVTPWNFPEAMATRKIGPALAAGCTVVLKPASETPLSALAVAQILTQAGVPAGVVNVVPSRHSGDISSTWLDDERVRMMSFTGSTGVGISLLQEAAKRVVNTGMELGGNAPFIVGPHADIDAAVEGAMVAKFRNAGQACTAANRFYVHESLMDEFLSKFAQRVKALTVGSAFTEGVEIGPMVNAKARTKINALIDEALAAGARVYAAAEMKADKGFFVAPQIVQVPDNDSPLFANEIFGPVAPVLAWKDEDELLAAVNHTEAGLAGYIFGDLQWCLRMGEKIETGMLGVNRGLVSDPAAPFGGYKQSGIGREGAREGIREFQETQYFSVAW